VRTWLELFAENEGAGWKDEIESVEMERMMTRPDALYTHLDILTISMYPIDNALMQHWLSKEQIQTVVGREAYRPYLSACSGVVLGCF